MHKVAKKINIITLGCSKNLVDSEQFAAQAQLAGYNVVHNSTDLDFQIAIVNTCGFINDAKEESINMILQLVNLKENNKLEKIIVFGCLTERYMADLKAEIPEVDVFIGNYNIDDLLRSIDREIDHDNRFSRIFDSPGHYAYLKIAEGCNRNCAFCAIPGIKGKFISRQMTDILEEAEQLAENGVKELILIAQDLSFYGYDLDKKFLLPELVEKLSEIKGVEWIRLHYLYPFLFPDNLIEVIGKNPKVCKYVDIPLQHISDNVLSKMNRGGTKQQTLELLDKFRKEIPDVVIRTTMLVGHPGETEKDFQELLEFIKEQKFDRLGVFTYSEEEGTIAAEKYDDSISEEVKEKRADQLMNIQSEISLQRNSEKLGNEIKVIVDRFEEGRYYCRSEYDSVEVDGEVIIDTAEDLKIGNFYLVKIIDFDEYDLYGEKI